MRLRLGGNRLPGGLETLNGQQLIDLVIRPTLEILGLYSPASCNLVFGTAAAESHCGKYLKQVGAGPALGIFQMEPATHDDIWRNYLRYNEGRAGALVRLSIPHKFGEAPEGVLVEAQEMVGNLYYATAMCRIHYLRKREPLPAADDLEGLAWYWKTHYNTLLGKGTVSHFLESWKACR